jgi:hypothetical protein
VKALAFVVALLSAVPAAAPESWSVELSEYAKGSHTLVCLRVSDYALKCSDLTAFLKAKADEQDAYDAIEERKEDLKRSWYRGEHQL